jgi:two-component system sensor histidine kinase RegB
MAETATTTGGEGGTSGDYSGRSLRLDTLVRLRWLAVAGQAVAVVFVRFVLDFPLPLFVCIVLIALSALLNVALRARSPATRRLPEWPAFALLAYDVLQLGALLYVTGGLENQFAILLLVPEIVSAATLPPRPTVLLGLMVVAAASVLAGSHWPLPWYPGDAFTLPLVYIAGGWVALVWACAFTGIYAFRVASEARQLARAVNAAEMVLAREQHLYALDGLAAAAAHELGTPLATIALVAKELERDTPAGSPHADDLALLISQSLRCRDILARLTSLSGQADDHRARRPLSHLIEQVVEAYRAFPVEIDAAPPKGEGPEPVGIRNPAIVQGLSNLVENAVDFAANKVTVATEWTATEVVVTIADDGPGFAIGIIDRIGEPYVTTRARAGEGLAEGEADGLGLGVFIAKTLLERSGASMTLSNREPPATGAVVVSIHDLSFEHLPQTFNMRSRTQLRLTVRHSAKRAARILTLSEYTRRDLIDTYGIEANRISAIPLAAPAHFAPVTEKRELQRVRHTYGIEGDYFLSVGSIQPRKNLVRLVKAYALLRGHDSNVKLPKLVLVGKCAWLYDETLRALEESGMKDAVVLTGYVPDEDLPALYSGALCFIYPSYFEGFGLPPLEAMKCGTPVIVGNKTSLPEVVGDAGITVDPFDVDSIAAAIQRLTGDADLRQELRVKGQRRASMFDWRETARRTLEVYEEVVRQTGASRQQAGSTQ